MILITGASGKTGQAIVRALAATNSSVRALVRRREQIELLDQIGATDVVVGDLRDPEVLQKAMIGIRACYHICPNVHPEEVSIGLAAISAAEAANVDRFVFHSVLHPQTRAMPHHWAKLRVEERLLESRLGYTILQPCAYMQNVSALWDSIVEAGEYVVPYRAETLMSLIDLEDVAVVARRVLTEEGHTGATFELCGPEILSQAAIASILSDCLSRPVEVVVESTEEWSRRARRSGLGQDAISMLVRMFEYYDRFGFWGNSRVAETLLDRTPSSFSEFVARTLTTETSI